MNALFQKISIFILAAACLILIVDKTKQSLRLNGVAARIAEKSSELERERSEFKAVREKLQNELRLRDETFRLIPPGRRSGKDVFLPQPADPKDSRLTRMAAKLTGEAASPARLARAFRKLAEEKQLFPDDFRIDPASGLVVSRAASLLSLAAKSAGMDVRPSLVWDMREFRPCASMEILPPDLPDRKIDAAPVTVHLSETGKAATADHRFSLRQDRAESVVFPFEATWRDAPEKELTLLPAGGLIPCGGLYLHYFSSDCRSEWFLEYEFPESVNPKEVNLQVVPLNVDMTVTSQISERVQSFLVRSDPDRPSAFLVGADKAFFPIRITAARAERKITPEKMKNGSPEEKQKASAISPLH